MVRTAAALLLFSSLASAQTYRPERLYVSSTFLHGSARLVGLGGAYAGVAEGADGMPTNMASVAQRSPDSRNGFEVEPLFSITELLRGQRDVDNDGVPDDADNTALIALGLRAQIHKVGVGIWYHNVATKFCTDTACTSQLTVDQARLVAGLGVTLWRDQLILAGALTSTLGGIRAHVDGDGDGQPDLNARAQVNAVGGGFELDFLFRPEGKPFRIGGSVKSGVAAEMQRTNRPPSDFFDRAVYSGMVNPAVASLGVAWRFGEGAEHYNLLSPWARHEYDELSYEQAQKLELTPEEQTGRLLLSTQLDATFPVSGAIGVSPLAKNSSQAPFVGTSASFTPRLGVEHLTLVHRLRLRGGSYLEPSIFPGVGARPHVTAGFDLFLFHLLADWTVKGSADLASHYQAFGLSVGFW